MFFFIIQFKHFLKDKWQNEMKKNKRKSFQFWIMKSSISVVCGSHWFLCVHDLQNWIYSKQLLKHFTKYFNISKTFWKENRTKKTPKKPSDLTLSLIERKKNLFCKTCFSSLLSAIYQNPHQQKRTCLLK